MNNTRAATSHSRLSERGQSKLYAPDGKRSGATFRCEDQTREKIAMHSNGPSVIYVFNDGRLRHTYPDGKVRETVAVSGAVVWDDAETHETENVGDTDIHSLKVELKGT